MNPHACTKCAGRLLMALAAITSILLMAACGSGSGLVTPLGGSFSNSSLSGTYVMKQTGYYLNSAGNGIPFSETTIFSANGKGALTVIEDDGGPQGPGSEMLAGSYGIERDGEGSLKFNNPSAISTYQITMIDTGHFYVVEGDSYASSSGYGVLQTSTATPSGTYVFKAHNFDTSSTVGVGTIISNGTFTGTQDILTLGGFELGPSDLGLREHAQLERRRHVHPERPDRQQFGQLLCDKFVRVLFHGEPRLRLARNRPGGRTNRHHPRSRNVRVRQPRRYD